MNARFGQLLERVNIVNPNCSDTINRAYFLDKFGAFYQTKDHEKLGG